MQVTLKVFHGSNTIDDRAVKEAPATLVVSRASKENFRFDLVVGEQRVISFLAPAGETVALGHSLGAAVTPDVAVEALVARPKAMVHVEPEKIMATIEECVEDVRDVIADRVAAMYPDSVQAQAFGSAYAEAIRAIPKDEIMLATPVRRAT